MGFENPLACLVLVLPSVEGKLFHTFRLGAHLEDYGLLWYEDIFAAL